MKVKHAKENTEGFGYSFNQVIYKLCYLGLT